MKKFFLGLGILGTLLFILLVIARITGMLQYYKTPTPANEPAIRQGERILSSILEEVSPYKFIVFTNAYADSINASFIPGFKRGSHYLYRLCGRPGDIIEMKNGVLWVNRKDFDGGLNLKIQYKILTREYQAMDPADINVNEASGQFMITGDSAIVTFDHFLFKKYQSRLKPVPFIMTEPTNDCFKWFDKNSTWTPDNFGPLKIPAGSYFVLGDNRHNAMDSRYIGFVKKDNVTGVVLYK